MKVITLFENRTISKDYKYSHGLSLYIETSNHKVLFDTGTDGSFAHNARKLGVKLEDIDIVVISHGCFWQPKNHALRNLIFPAPYSHYWVFMVECVKR
jgi:G:T-mismatch repair DNA endonuclease (very short patch repair protein)